MNLLVTGGAGFIGSNFVRLVQPNGGTIVNLDSLSYAGNPANLADLENEANYHFVHGSIEDSDLVGQLLRDHKIDAIVNFAAESHVDRSIESPEPFIQTNVVGTLRLLEAARQYWKQLDAEKQQSFRFLHVSTDEVFGSLSPQDPAFHEETAYDPRSPYSASKAASDHLVRAYQHTYGLPTLITNCSNNYGPFQFPEKLIPLMILSAIDGKNLPIYGKGDNVRDWLYVTDHCEAIAAVLERGIVGETYCVGGHSEKQNIEVVDTLIQILDRLHPRPDGASYASQKTFVQDRPGHDKRYAINTDKIGRELNWQPEIPFAQGMEQTVAWYLENRDWCQNILDGSYQLQRLGSEK